MLMSLNGVLSHLSCWLARVGVELCRGLSMCCSVGVVQSSGSSGREYTELCSRL